MKKTEEQKNVWDVRVGELDQYLFGQGNHYDIYKKLGAHPAVIDRERGGYYYL